jgi:hypothetical protein
VVDIIAKKDKHEEFNKIEDNLVAKRLVISIAVPVVRLQAGKEISRSNFRSETFGNTESSVWAKKFVLVKNVANHAGEIFRNLEF